MSETKSARAELAERLAALVRETRMTAPFGGDVVRGKRSYDILFAKPATLDGLIQVFGPKFILIQCQGRAAPGYDWREVYQSEADAVAFLTAVASVDNAAAQAVPHRKRG